MGVVVFDITSFSKMQIFLPVIRQLEARHGLRCLVLSSSEINPGQPTDVQALRRWGVEHLQVLPITPSASFRSVDWYLYLVWLRRNAQRFLQHCDASVLVTSNDRTYPCHFYIDAAKKLGIPTVLVQEALRKDQLLELPPREKARRLVDKLVFGIDSRLRKYGQGGCTRIAAWGETSRDYFLAVGVAPERVVVTGNPALDEIETRDWRPDAEAVGDELGLAGGDVVVSFLPNRLAKQGFLTEEQLASRVRWFFTEFRALAARTPEAPLKLVIKVKASNLDEEQFYARLVDDLRLGSLCCVTARAPIYPLLQRSDAAVMFSSTAGLEAALFAKPVAILDVGRPLDDWRFVERGVAVPISSQGDLARYLATVSSAEQRTCLGQQCRAKAKQYVAHLGRAAENVAALIAQADQAVAR